MDYGGGQVQVRLSASGSNFGLLGTPEILAGLQEAVGYCVIVAGSYTPSGYVVTGWTLLTDSSAGDVPYTSCADILEASAGAGQVPTTETPPSGGGEQPTPGEGQTPAEGSPPDAGANGEGTTTGEGATNGEGTTTTTTTGATIAGVPAWLALGLAGAFLVARKK